VIFTTLTTCNTPCACRNPVSLLCNNSVEVCVCSIILFIDRLRLCFRLGRLQDSNAVLSHFNDFSQHCFAEISGDIARNTRVLKSVKSDLDYIFQKLRFFLFFFSVHCCVFFVLSIAITASSFIHCFRIFYLLFGYSRPAERSGFIPRRVE